MKRLEGQGPCSKERVRSPCPCLSLLFRSCSPDGGAPKFSVGRCSRENKLLNWHMETHTHMHKCTHKAKVEAMWSLPSVHALYPP